MLRRNVCSIDRLLRIGAGAVLGVLALSGTLSTPWTAAAIAVGILMIGTAAAGRCPLYVPLRVSSCRDRRTG